MKIFLYVFLFIISSLIIYIIPSFLYTDQEFDLDKHTKHNLIIFDKILKNFFYDIEKEPYSLDNNNLNKIYKKNNKYIYKPKQLSEIISNLVVISSKPKEEDEYIYKDGNVLKEKTIAYYLNKKENLYYLYGVGKDNKIIRDKNKRTGNLFFNRYKPFCVTNEGTEYSGFPKK